MAKRRKLSKAEEKSNRATVLNSRTIEKFADLTRRGLPADAVCDYLGISNYVFWTWQRKGQAYIEGGYEPKKHRIYGEFYQEWKRATAEYRLDLVERAHEKGNKEWVQPLAILERRDRKSFGRKDPIGGGESSYDPDERFA